MLWLSFNFNGNYQRIRQNSGVKKKKHPFDKLDFLPGPKFNFAK